VGNRFLAEASKQLAATHDLDETVQLVANLVVPYLAEFAVVDLLEENEIHRVAVAHADAADEALAAEMFRWPPKLDRPFGVARILRERASEVIPEVDEQILLRNARGPEHVEFLRRLRMESYLCVPMILRGEAIGTLMLIGRAPRAAYGPVELALAEDLAYRAALAVENARLLRRLEQANRAKDDFIANVSHELRTPLSSMSLWIDLLASHDATLSDRARGVLRECVRQQSRLIDDLLDLSRIIAGTLRLYPRHVELGEIARSALDIVQPAAERKRLTLALALQSEPICVDGDPGRLKQILVNLLYNAIKFTRDGGRVHLAMSAEGDRARIAVADDGVGIEPRFLPRLFQRFKQEGATGTAGLGLGLAIVRHLVELHGGSVSAHSEGRNLGATFTVELPTVAAESEPLPGAETRRAALDGVRVLLVEDQEEIREVVTVALQSAGAVVTPACSAAEAMQLFSDARPEVLLSDIAMPDEDGYSLIRRVRALGADHGGAVPAAALTAWCRPEDRRQALAAGFQMHLPKPVDFGELTEVVARLAGRDFS
jgi:signal transduction histidine kinase/ActR/RegA family two-component response regulator